MNKFVWKDQGSEPGDDQVCGWNGYTLQAEQLDDELFYCGVDVSNKEAIFHNTWGEEPNRIFPMSWQSARHLCEMVALEHWIRSQPDSQTEEGGE